MKQALFKCMGSGKCVYLEELPNRKLRLLIGFNKADLPDGQIIEWLEDNGTEQIQKSNFEFLFDHYNNTQMRCLKHRKK